MSKPEKTNALAELKRQLARLSPKKQLDTLLSQSNAKAAVRSVPAEQLYASIADVGLADATEIVQLASPAQFQTFLDLGGWSRDRIEPHSVLQWLRAARGDEPEELLSKLDKMDLEVLEYTLRAFTVVHDLEENPDVNPEGVTLETPEGKYLIEFKVEGAELAGMRALVNDLIAKDPFQAGRLIEALRWELDSDLEENAYRFRSARLEDLGFPPLEQALALFTFVDPSSLKATSGAPGTALAPAHERVDFFERAYSGLSGDEQDALGEELRYLVNATLVAEAAEPGELEAVRRIAEMARDYLSLGIEQLAGGEAALAAEVVREHELRRVFQVGFSLTLMLKFRVDRLAKAPLASFGNTWWVLPEEAAVLSALRRKRPLRALKVQGAEPVPFRSRRELEEASRVVDRAERQVVVFRALLGGSDEAAKETLARFSNEPELTPQKLLIAAAAHAVLGGERQVAPVPASELDALAEKLFEGDAAKPKVRAAAIAAATTALAAEGVESELRSMLDRALGQLAAELGPAYLATRRLDAAVSALLIPLAGQP